MLKYSLIIAWRNLIRNKRYSFINLLGLGIGLACVAVIILYISDEASYDRFHEKGKHIYRIVRDIRGPEGKEEKAGNTGGIHGMAFKEEIPEIEAFCRVNGGGQELVRLGEEVNSEGMMYSDNNFFQFFSFRLIKGNPSTVFPNPNSVVMTESAAYKYFGGNDIVGKTLEINQGGKFELFTITGVAENMPANSSIQFEFLLPIKRTLTQSWTMDWSNAFLNTFVMLRADADAKAAENKMAAVFEKYMGEQMAEDRKQFPGAYLKYKLQSIFDLHLAEEYEASNGLEGASKARYSYILGGIAVFILLIACINFINLSLAAAVRRGKEIGMRKVTGGTRKQLMLQFLTESLLTTICAFFLALVILSVSLPFFNELANKKLSLTYLVQPQIIGAFCLLIIVNTTLSGSYPALVLSRFNAIQVLYGPFKLSGKNYLGQALVIVQFVLATVLIIGVAVMERQLGFLMKKDLGFKAQGIVTLKVPFGNENIPLIKNELQKHPAIIDLAAYTGSFLYRSAIGVKADGKEMFNVPFCRIDERWLPQLQIPVVEGKNFRGIPGDTAFCVVNQAFVKAAGFKDPIGRSVEFNGRELTIIGTTIDFNFLSLKEKIEPLLMTQAPDFGFSQLMIKIDLKQKVKAVEAIQAAYKKIIPFYPCNYNFLEDDLSKQYEAEKRWKKIISIASALTIFISCTGLFALASLSIKQQTKDIGIRKVLGASVVNIVESISARFLKLVLLAALIASPVAWYFSSIWLDNFPYRTNLSVSLFAMCALGSLFLAFVTISIQTIKAAIANPVKSLRAE